MGQYHHPRDVVVFFNKKKIVLSLLRGRPSVRSNSLQSACPFVLILPKTTSVCSWFLLLGFPDDIPRYWGGCGKGGCGEGALEDIYSVGGYPGLTVSSQAPGQVSNVIFLGIGEEGKALGTPRGRSAGPMSTPVMGPALAWVSEVSTVCIHHWEPQT